jgi:hypothetical protein
MKTSNVTYVSSLYQRNAGDRLMWSEYIYLVGVGIAMFIVVDPFQWDLPNNKDVKYMGLALTLPAIVLSLVGHGLRERQRGSMLGQAVRGAWPLAVLALLIVMGSAYTRFMQGTRETVLAFGLSMLVLFFSAAMIVSTKAPDAMIRAYFRILIVGAIVMSLYLITFYGEEHVYHEEIFLIVPLAVYCVLALKNPLLRIAGTVFFLMMAVLSVKNTAYLTGLLVLLYLGYGFWLPRLLRKNPLSRFSGYYLIFVIFLLIAGAVLFLLTFRETYLPSGSVDFRLFYYERAWNRFLDSPIWGTMFTGSPVEKYPTHAIEAAGGILPTHSDVMDLLAFGGAIGIGLWLYGLLLVARAGNRTLLNPTTYEHRWAPYAHSLAVMSLAAIIAYSVNPILNQPALSYFVWSNLGVLLGLSLRAPQKKEIPSRQRDFAELARSS